MPQPTPRAKSDLSTNRKKLLAISSATLLLGGAAWALTQKNTATTTETEVDDPQSPSGVTVVPVSGSIPSDIDVAGKVTDAMSFEQAFEAARAEVGMGGVFSWHGRWYNTFNQDEWRSLSLEQRQEFTEMITQEELPVRLYHQPAEQPAATTLVSQETVPTLIEGHLNGQRVMGLDFDQDGVIDTLVMEGADGYTYRVVDTSGDQGLDTLYRFDSLDGELVEIQKIEAPFVLSNDQFSEGLEASMSREIVDSIVEPELVEPTLPADDDLLDTVQDDHQDDIYLAGGNESDDTYINDGDVRDMDE